MKVRREGLREERMALQMRLKALNKEAEGLTALVQHEEAAAETIGPCEPQQAKADGVSLDHPALDGQRLLGTLDDGQVSVDRAFGCGHEVESQPHRGVAQLEAADPGCDLIVGCRGECVPSRGRAG